MKLSVFIDWNGLRGMGPIQLFELKIGTTPARWLFIEKRNIIIFLKKSFFIETITFIEKKWKTTPSPQKTG